jgi:hypothetical protein
VKSTPAKLINQVLLSGLLLGVCLALSATSLAQNQYYVSPSGSDSNSGTSGSPWKTIGHAASALTLGTGGAVVNVASGTYGCATTSRSGTASQPIVYKSTTQYGAKIVCSSGSDTAWENTGAFVTIQAFDVTGGTSVCYGVHLNGASDRLLGDYIHDIHAVGCAYGGAGVANGSGTNGNSPDTQIIGNIIASIGITNGSCSTIHGIYMSSPRTIVQNNIVSGACAWGIQSYHNTTSNVISNNTVIGNLRGGILTTASDGFTADNTSVLNNIVVNNAVFGGVQESGIEERWGAAGPNNVYRNNLVVHNSPAPFNFTFGSRTTTGNLCDVPGTGCQTVITSSQALTSNIFVNYTGNAKTGDYHLKAGSIGINAGVAGACASGGISPCVPTTDILGVIRPSGSTLAVGAFEQGSAVADAPSAPTGLTATAQ